MAVDRNGYITVPKHSAFQPAFSSVVAQVVAALCLRFPNLIHSLYVYGSVAEGRAIIGKSDLDITLVFHDELRQPIAEELTAIQLELEKSYPIVSKIDFDCGLLHQVMLPDNRLSWGYWLRHHCVCVYGDDLGRRFPVFKPAKAIAVAVNGDFMSVLDKLLSQMQSSTDEHKILQLQRAAARKLIRATSILRHEQDDDWPETLQEHCIKFKCRYPSLSDSIDDLLATSYEPLGDVDNFRMRIMAFARWLNTEFHQQQS